MVDVAQLSEQLKCQFSHLLVLADKARLQCIQACLSITTILLIEGLEFLGVFIEKGVEEDDGVEIITHSLHDYVRQVLVLIGKQPQYLLQVHPQRGLQQ